MKFSHSIQFNAVPDWSSHYISYSNLKKSIYQLEKRQNANAANTPAVHDPESSPLLEASLDDPDDLFTRLLDHDLENICSFYQSKEHEIVQEVDAFLADLHEYEEARDAGVDTVNSNARPGLFSRAGLTSPFKSRRSDSSNRRRSSVSVKDRRSDDIEIPINANTESADSRPQSRQAVPQARRQSYSAFATLDQPDSPKRRPSGDDDEPYYTELYAQGITLKKRAISLYVNLCELRSYIQLNRTGFSKVLKKYDKTLDRNLKNAYLKDKIEDDAYPFRRTTTEGINDRVAIIEKAYANVITKGDVEIARQELRLHLREHVVWERNTVWREMIGIERKAQAANMGIRQTVLGAETDPRKARLQGDEPHATMTDIKTPAGRLRCPTFLLSSTFYTLIAILVVFALLLLLPIMHQPEQQNCLALVVLVSLLWATEAIPLFVTSLLVPFLVVVLGVARTDDRPHHRLDAKHAANYVFSAMWTPVIMLLLGGFTIAAALSKYNIAKMMATFVLSKAGTKPSTVIVTSMFVSMFASMWISNVAAPVLCYSIIQPILRNLPPDSNMSKALIIGIALAANMGGAASPIASPQNLIALQNMTPTPGWGVWFFVALPVCIVSILLIWLMLIATFRPGRNTNIVPIRPMKDKFTGIQWFISIVTLLTIVLWCVSHQLQPMFGDMGVVAIIPMVLFFGTGILTKEDFNNFLWTIIILAAGGLALGKAVSSSGLLHTIANAMTARVEHLSLYVVLLVFAGLTLVVATFISHTVAALIVLPLVHQVGQNMDQPHPNLLVMGSVLMASAAMGLPTSGFPNMTAIMMEDPQTGQRYLQVRHFLTCGIPASLIAYVVVVTIGYGTMTVVGF